MKTPEKKYEPGVELKLLSRKMVHRLNNMLFVIDSYSEFIKEAHPGDPETLENIKHIQTAAEQSLIEMQNWRKQADELIPDPDETDSIL